MGDPLGDIKKKMQAQLDLQSPENQTRIQNERFNTQLAAARKARNEDMAEGRARGEEIFKEGNLGRVRADRSADTADIIARRKENLKGFSQEEQNAMKEGALKTLDQNAQTSARQLALQQARSGVRGATAAAQSASLQKGLAGAKADQERELFLQNVNQKRAALDALEGSTGRTEADELGRQQFNIGQQNKETYGKLSTEMGFGSLGAGERAAIMENVLGQRQADVAANMPKGGKK